MVHDGGLRHLPLVAAEVHGGGMSAELEQVARALVTPGKGLLAADESTPTIRRRFEAISVESTEESRRCYRELLLTAPDLGGYISGVILFDETLRQNTGDGVPFP